MAKALNEIKKRSLTDIIGKLKDPSGEVSAQAGERLCNDAKQYGIGVADYLRLAVDMTAEVRKTENGADFMSQVRSQGLDGFEATLAFLDMPVDNNFQKQILLANTADTFATYPGTRTLFPAVIDALIKVTPRQDNIEKISEIVGNSRTINGVEMISTVINAEEERAKTYAISQGANIPIDMIESQEVAVKMFKHGRGIGFTYEFERRAAIDLITPYAQRIARTKERSKVAAALGIIINGDGVNGAAPTVTQTAMGGTGSELQYKPLFKWLVKRAQAGSPVDVLIGNYDMYFQFMQMFEPNLNVQSLPEAYARHGAMSFNSAFNLTAPVRFALASTAPANTLIGITKNETLEELVEANSQISESERAIRSQNIVYVNTETSGYRLVYGDTRSIYTVS